MPSEKEPQAEPDGTGELHGPTTASSEHVESNENREGLRLTDPFQSPDSRAVISDEGPVGTQQTQHHKRLTATYVLAKVHRQQLTAGRAAGTRWYSIVFFLALKSAHVFALDRRHREPEEPELPVTYLRLRGDFQPDRDAQIIRADRREKPGLDKAHTDTAMFPHFVLCLYCTENAGAHPKPWTHWS